MGLIDRLIGRVVGRLPSRRNAAVVRADDDGLVVTGGGRSVTYGWGRVTRVVAMQAEQLASNTHVLVFGLDGGESLLVPETDAGYRQTVALVARHLPGSLPAPVWQVQLMAAPTSRIEVFRRG